MERCEMILRMLWRGINDLDMIRRGLDRDGLRAIAFMGEAGGLPDAESDAFGDLRRELKLVSMLFIRVGGENTTSFGSLVALANGRGRDICVMGESRVDPCLNGEIAGRVVVGGGGDNTADFGICFTVTGRIGDAGSEISFGSLCFANVVPSAVSNVDVVVVGTNFGGA